jgi:hypothetical protein
MASKFRESPHWRRRGLHIPPHLHWGESGQSRLERETGAVCLILRRPWDGIGCPATRAKSPEFIPEHSRGFENPLPRTESPGLAQLKQFFDPIRQNLRRPIRSSEICRNSRPRTDVLGGIRRAGRNQHRANTHRPSRCPCSDRPVSLGKRCRIGETHTAFADVTK